MRNPGVIAELMVAALMEMLYDLFSYSHFSIIPPHANSKYVLQIAGGDDDCTQDNDDQPRRRPMVMPLKGTAED